MSERGRPLSREKSVWKQDEKSDAAIGQTHVNNDVVIDRRTPRVTYIDVLHIDRRTARMT